MPPFSVLKSFVTILAFAAIAACGSQPPPLSLANQNVVRVTTGDALPAPAGDAAPGVTNARLAARDRVAITVFNLPEVSLPDVQISAAGNIAVPLAGNFVAAGKTPAELGQEIEAALARNYVRNPRVAVNVREAAEKVFTIDGAVNRPGQYAALEDLSLMKAVAIGQGLNETAKLESVVVYRSVGQQQMAAIYDLAAIRQGVYADPKIYPNDTILVGESAARRLYRDFKLILPTLASPLVFVLQQF